VLRRHIESGSAPESGFVTDVVNLCVKDGGRAWLTHTFGMFLVRLVLLRGAQV